MPNFPETALDIAISRVRQANYLTPTAAAANAFVEERVKQRSLAQVSANTINNEDYSGGQGWATESWRESWTSELSYSLDLASQNIGRYLLAAMGSYAVSQPDAVGNPTVYRHVFTPLDRRTTAMLPAFSLLQQVQPAASGVNSLFPAMVCDELSLQSQGKARVEGNVKWTGSGEETSPSGVTWATHVAPQTSMNYYFHQQSNLKIGDFPTFGSPVDLTTCDLLSWSFKVMNEHSGDDYGCPRFKVANQLESGAMRNHYLLLKQKFMLDFMLKMRANNPEHTAFVNQSPLELEAKLTGNLISGTFSHQLKITTYLAKYNTVERGFENGFLTMQVTPDLLFSSTDNKIVEIELTNTISSYVT